MVEGVNSTPLNPGSTAPVHPPVKPKRVALVGMPILQLDAPAYCKVLQK
jgi:hypothetical protein